MYTIEINKSQKKMIVKGMGMYSQEELNEFMATFRNKANSIKSADYTLILDTKSLSTATQDQVPMMTSIMNMYFDTPFKERFYIKPDSKVASMQMKRITESDAYKTLRVLEDY